MTGRKVDKYLVTTVNMYVYLLKMHYTFMDLYRLSAKYPDLSRTHFTAQNNKHE